MEEKALEAKQKHVHVAPPLSRGERLLWHAGSWLIRAFGLFVMLPYYMLTKEEWVGKLVGLVRQQRVRQLEDGAAHQGGAQGGVKGRSVLCLGDSLTEGAVSSDWVARLQALYPALHFVNAGLGGQVSDSTANKLDGVLKAHPDFEAATLLIGTNDVLARQSQEAHTSYSTLNGVKDADFSKQVYAGNVDRILKALRRQSPNAVLLVISIPPIGEDLASRINAQVAAYNDALREVAAANKAAVLDLHGACMRAIEAVRGPGGKLRPARTFRPHLFIYPLVVAVSLRMCTGSWDEVAAWMGSTILFDNIHMSDAGGELLLGLLRPVLEKTVVPEP